MPLHAPKNSGEPIASFSSSPLAIIQRFLVFSCCLGLAGFLAIVAVQKGNQHQWQLPFSAKGKPGWTWLAEGSVIIFSIIFSVIALFALISMVRFIRNKIVIFENGIQCGPNDLDDCVLWSEVDSINKIIQYKTPVYALGGFWRLVAPKSKIITYKIELNNSEKVYWIDGSTVKQFKKLAMMLHEIAIKKKITLTMDEGRQPL